MATHCSSTSSRRPSRASVRCECCACSACTHQRRSSSNVGCGSSRGAWFQGWSWMTTSPAPSRRS
eukprot:2812298-Prymnesium_polylepis.1